MGKILVVDSSLLDRKRMRTVLEAAGHAVVEVSTPTQALEELFQLPQGSFSLILTELTFPDMTGLDFIHRVKNSDWSRHIPVLVVTAQPPRDMLIEVVSAGATTLVTKPFGADMLLRRVTETFAEQMVLRQGMNESVSWHIAEYLRKELKRAERNGSTYSVVVCRVLDDLNGQALPHLLGGLAHIMRETDTLARLSESEIVILLPETDWDGVSIVESRVRSVIQGISETQKGRMVIPLQVATGSATFPSEALDGDSLISLAQARCL